MKQSIPRIGRVRLHNGGTVHRLPVERYEDWRGTLLEHARTVAGNFSPNEVVGFVVVAWAADSSYSVGYRFDEANSQIGRTLLPSWLGDVVRSNLIEDGAWPAE